MLAMLGLGGAELMLLMLAALLVLLPVYGVLLFATMAAFRRPPPAAATRSGAPAKLWRSSQDSWFAGVCGGLAEYLGWNAGQLRFVWVLATIFTAFTGVVFYVVLWFLMPLAPPPAPAFESPPMQPWKKGT